MDPHKRKVILITGVSIFLAMVFMILATTIPRIGKVEIEIVTAPSEATFTLDDQKIGPGKHYVTEGEHTVKATLELFEDSVKKIDTRTLDKGEKIYIYPIAKSEAAIQWLIDHPKASEELNILGGGESSATTQAVQEDFPLVKELPYEAITFKIDYSLNSDNSKITYNVTLLPYLTANQSGYKEQLLEYKANADKYLTKNSVDLSTATVTYKPDPATLK